MNWERLTRRAVAFLLFGIGAMGWCYLSVYLAGRNPVTVEMFGPRVYAIDGWIWATWQGVFGFAAAAGILRPTRPGAILAIVACLALAAEFTIFALMSAAAPHGLIVAAGSMFVTLPVAVVGFHVAKEALRDAG